MIENTYIYKQTLQDLEIRRAARIAELTRQDPELAKLDNAISALRATMAAEIPNSAPARIAKPSDHLKRYAGMSVRWAVLKLLAETLGSVGMKTADIATELTSGGNENATRANVSAVISDMVNRRGEVESSEDGVYQLTETGRLAWNAIRHSARYLNRLSPLKAREGDSDA